MFIDDLKKSILQKAIQWKLVEQNPNDEPASELLKGIREEKEKLIKDGKIKKEKGVSPITDEEKPFDIPSSWEWVRIWDACLFSFCWKSPEYEKENNWNYTLWQAANQEWYIDFSKSKFSTNTHIEKCEEFQFLVEWDTLLNTLWWWTVGRIWLFKNPNGYRCITDWHIFVFRTWWLFIPEYLFYALKSKQKEFEEMAEWSTNQCFLKLWAIKNCIFPLPPLEEQKRIVAKLDELMPLLDEARPLEEEITKLEKDFSSKFRQSILQYAIQWKLVEQNSGDEPASELLKKIKEEKEKLIKEWKIKKEKPLEPITDEEKLFDIPSNWEWVRIPTLMYFQQWVQIDTSYQKEKDDGNSIPFLRIVNFTQNDVRETRYVDKSFIVNSALINENDLVMIRYWATAWKIFFWKYGLLANNLFTINLYSEKTLKTYIKLFFQTDIVYKKIIFDKWDTAMPSINFSTMNKVIIPLPPLEEQKRIVAKLDELMKLCDELEEQIG